MCWSSTRRSSRSTSARSGARRCCCSRTRPRSSRSARRTCTGRRGSLPRPVVIRLVTYVRIPRDTHKRKITRRAVFARDGWTVPVLRRPHEPHGRPRDPALQGRRLRLGQHRRLVRAVQPPQGRPAAAPDQHAPAHEAAHAGRAHLHPARVADDPGDLAPVPACAKRPSRPRPLSLLVRTSGEPASRLRRRGCSAGAATHTKTRRGPGPTNRGLRLQPRWTRPPSPTFLNRAGGTSSGIGDGGAPVWIPLDAGPAPAGLAAGHLQGPARTVTQLRTTPFLW